MFQGFLHSSLYGSCILPISLFSSFYSLSLDSSWPISSFFLIIFIIFCLLISSSFQYLQFLSNLAQYSLLYLLSVHLYNFLTINLSSNFPLLNVSSSLSCFLTFSISLLYSFLNSFITSFVFSRFSFSSQVSNSAINPFYCTRYLFFPLIYCLFNFFLLSILLYLWL